MQISTYPVDIAVLIIIFIKKLKLDIQHFSLCYTRTNFYDIIILEVLVAIQIT